MAKHSVTRSSRVVEPGLSQRVKNADFHHSTQRLSSATLSGLELRENVHVFTMEVIVWLSKYNMH